MYKYDFEDVKNLYEKEIQLTEDKNAYKCISQVLEEVEGPYKKDFLERNPGKTSNSVQQSWRKFKGDCFERLLQHIIAEVIEPFELKVVNGNDLEKSGLSPQLDAVRRNIIINYGESGKHLPDADIIVYKPENSEVVAIISSKTSLRERLTQTGYWKFKLLENKNTAHIKVYLVTSDHKILKKKKSAGKVKKARAIAEEDFDGTYVLTELTEVDFEESDKVKLFEHFIEDLKQLLEKH